MKNVAVIGSGTMGNGIAQVFATSGFNVHLIDISMSSLLQAELNIHKNLDRLISKEKLALNSKPDIINNIHFTTDLETGVNDAFIVVEAISENILLKEKLFNQLDKLTNNTCILASNTSSISITALASFTNRPENVIGMHFMNPVPVMPLVEIIPGLLTAKEVTNKVIEISALLNKTPLVVSDFPGFISNRILMPMINEAILSLQENVAGVNEIDQIMKLGMAHPMGPLQLADYIGLDVCLSILNVLKDGFGNPKYAPAVLLVNMVKAGKLGVKSGEGFYKYNDLKKISGISALFAN
ncbi:MAG: 3-hydroxyacyl-CoA dehydrogenase family protein [Saprospiraceae bacterium]|jgi:3-hydroxybutyryl-CoA dehydrogenase